MPVSIYATTPCSPTALNQRTNAGHERRDPASVQRRISPSDGVDRVLGQYDIDQWRDLVSVRIKDPVEGADGESSFKATE